jgi:hypothetical protein
LFLRISVRGIGDAPDDLLDERQIKVRDTSFRYAYYAMGYLLAGLLILMLSGPELKLFEPEGNDGSYDQLQFYSLLPLCHPWSWPGASKIFDDNAT